MRGFRPAGIVLLATLGCALAACAGLAPDATDTPDTTRTPQDGLVGTGEFSSPDGETSGRVRVTLEELTDGYGEPLVVAQPDARDLRE